MPAFGPVASTPVASIGQGLPGTYINPGMGDLLLEGFSPGIIGASPVQVYRVVRETMVTREGDVRTGGYFRETLRSTLSLDVIWSHAISRETHRDSPVADIHSYNISREILRTSTLGSLQSYAWARETLRAPAATNLLAYSFFREVLVSGRNSRRYIASVSIIW